MAPGRLLGRPELGLISVRPGRQAYTRL